MKLLDNIATQRKADRQALAYRELIRREAKIGGQLFGTVPAGARREFFCLDEYTWVWHEEWTDAKTAQRRVVTTRYDVRPNGVLKAQDGQGYRYIEATEAQNFRRAVELYKARIDNEIYGVPA